MAFDFPAAPADGTEFTPAGGPTYVFQTPIWLLKSDTASNITISDTAPAAPLHEDLWWESDSGTLFIYYDDGNSAQWVQAAGAAGAPPVAAEVGDGTTVTVASPFSVIPAGIVSTDAGNELTIGTDGKLQLNEISCMSSVAADLSYCIKPDAAGPGLHRYVWNDAVDGTGVDLATLDTNGTFTSKSHVVAGSGNLFSGAGTSGLVITNVDPNPIYIRPLGSSDLTMQAVLATDGRLDLSGDYRTRTGIFESVIGTAVLSTIGSGSVFLRPNGKGVTTGQNVTLTTGVFQVTHTGAAKPGGGDWAVASDARIKNVLGDYDAGLDEIMALRPVRYVYKGNDTMLSPEIDPTGALEPLDKSTLTAPYAQSMNYQAATDATEFVGFVADEVEAVMPEMLFTTPGFIDGVAADIKNLNTTPLIYALLNAVKTLSAANDDLVARVAALEGAV